MRDLHEFLSDQASLKDSLIVAVGKDSIATYIELAKAGASHFVILDSLYEGPEIDIDDITPLATTYYDHECTVYLFKNLKEYSEKRASKYIQCSAYANVVFLVDQTIVTNQQVIEDLTSLGFELINIKEDR